MNYAMEWLFQQILSGMKIVELRKNYPILFEADQVLFHIDMICILYAMQFIHSMQ